MNGINHSLNRQELYQTFDQMNYMRTWFKLVEKMEKEGFTWASLQENDEWNQYMSPSLYTMPQKRWNEVMEATKNIQHVLMKTYRYLYEHKELLTKLNLPFSTWDATFTHMGNRLFSYFSRFDLIVTDEKIKVIEVNVDTPTGLVEPSIGNRIICDKYGVSTPNTIEDKLIQAWNMIIEDYGIQPDDTIYYSSYDWHEEDYQTVEFNLKHCSHPNKEFIGIEDIIVADDGLYTDEGKKITYLYRLYPIEYLHEDVDDKGKLIGQLFLDHIAQGYVKIINPPSAFLMQAKTVMAIIWELHQLNHELYTNEEHEMIESYFLPTYFTDEPFKNKGVSYVSKPIWGREGGGVSIIEGNNLVEDTTPYYYEQKKIYQEYIEMPTQSIGTWDGEYTGKLLFGSHVIGGEPAGLFLRIGEKITGNLSMFMGITIE